MPELHARVVSERKLTLPGRSRLVRYIWREGVPYSFVQDERSLSNASFLDVSLCKWLLDERWESKSVSWIRIDLDGEPTFQSGSSGVASAGSYGVSVIAENVLSAVDRRAFLRATLWFARHLRGRVLLPKQDGWYTAQAFEMHFASEISARFALEAPGDA